MNTRALKPPLGLHSAQDAVSATRSLRRDWPPESGEKPTLARYGRVDRNLTREAPMRVFGLALAGGVDLGL